MIRTASSTNAPNARKGTKYRMYKSQYELKSRLPPGMPLDRLPRAHDKSNKTRTGRSRFLAFGK